jgi:hypothetical protein
MYKIKIFCDFCTSEACKTNFEKVFNSKNCDSYGEDKDFFITNGEYYTHAIIMNKATPYLTIPKENVVGLAFEPRELLNLNQEFINYAKKHIGKYLIGQSAGLPELFIEHYAFMWHNNPHRSISFNEKKYAMSIVLSEKVFAPGHKYRHDLTNEILNNNLPIHIYGRGANNFLNHVNNNNNIKGPFNIDNLPYEKYMFSICIENFQSSDYISEKILDSLYHNCVPIYLGAKNIDNYANNVIHLKGELKHDIELLTNIVKDPLRYYNATYNEENLRNFNFFENIQKFF